MISSTIILALCPYIEDIEMAHDDDDDVCIYSIILDYKLAEIKIL